MATAINAPKHPGGPFQKGHPRYGGRKKGSQNVIPRSHREAMNRAAALLGSDFAKGDEDALTAFYVELGRKKFEALAAHVVTANVPKAKPADEQTNGHSAGPCELTIVAVPPGQYVCPKTGNLLDQRGNWTGLSFDLITRKLTVPEDFPFDPHQPFEATPARTGNVVEMPTPEPQAPSAPDPTFVDEYGRPLDIDALPRKVLGKHADGFGDDIPPKLAPRT